MEPRKDHTFMDTRAVADALGTDPKTLRRFLRDAATSFTPVGSGGRYSFTDKDIKTLRTEFEPWSDRQAKKVAAKSSVPRVTTSARARKRAMTPADRDRLVWEEEGQIILEDLRDPRVRARVRASAQAAEDRLEAQLLAAGLHVIQMRDRATV
jgi:hypothetical protein